MQKGFVGILLVLIFGVVSGVLIYIGLTTSKKSQSEHEQPTEPSTIDVSVTSPTPGSSQRLPSGNTTSRITVTPTRSSTQPNQSGIQYTISPTQSAQAYSNSTSTPTTMKTPTPTSKSKGNGGGGTGISTGG